MATASRHGQVVRLAVRGRPHRGVSKLERSSATLFSVAPVLASGVRGGRNSRVGRLSAREQTKRGAIRGTQKRTNARPHVEGSRRVPSARNTSTDSTTVAPNAGSEQSRDCVAAAAPAGRGRHFLYTTDDNRQQMTASCTGRRPRRPHCPSLRWPRLPPRRRHRRRRPQSPNQT